MEHLREAEEWLRANTSPKTLDYLVSEFSDNLRYSLAEVTESFNDTKNCALGLDGISKSIIDPFLCLIASTFASIFTATGKLQYSALSRRKGMIGKT